MSTKVFKVLPLQLFVEVELDVRTLIIVSPQDESGLFNVSESSVRSFVRALPKRDILFPQDSPEHSQRMRVFGEFYDAARNPSPTSISTIWGRVRCFLN
jgi:hypothetical protein